MTDTDELLAQYMLLAKNGSATNLEDQLVAALRAMLAKPCPYVETSDEGTSYCRLAAAGSAAPEGDT